MKITRITLICGVAIIALAQYRITPLRAQPQSVSQDAAEQAHTPPAAQEARAVSPAIDIKRLSGTAPLYSIELRDVQLGDLFRVIAHDYGLNIIVDNSVSGSITASFSNISLEEALEGIAELSNLVMEKKGNIIRLSPNLITKTFVLKFIEAKKLLESSGSSPAAVGSGSSESTIYDLLSSKGKVLLGKQPNSLTVIDYPPNITKIENYLKVIDQRMTSKVFKLKYLKASDVVGDTSVSGGSSGSADSSGTATSASGTN